MCGARHKQLCYIFRERWSNVLSIIFLYKLKPHQMSRDIIIVIPQRQVRFRNFN